MSKKDLVKICMYNCTKPATSKLDENSKASEITMSKELGKMTL